ncbi:hypothetical protein ACFP56_07010 [Paenibacillus septentrionalis]|uniref:Uncharacterized protein n=1 Tax=Paenibacillus septentrionalis TaxID=429342 RepID=A0ABW1V0U8_9BACL
MDNLVELFIMIIAGIFLLALLYRSFYRWLHAPATISRIKLGRGGKLKDNDPNVELLERHGYVVISGRHQIPVVVEVDNDILERSTSIIIDYIAEKKGLSYIVKYERERQPIELTAADLKKQLLMYTLLLPDMSGILYINHKENYIHKIAFHVAE